MRRPRRYQGLTCATKCVACPPPSLGLEALDSQAPGEANNDGNGPVKLGRFGTYGDDTPQFVMDMFGATQGDPN